MLIEISNEKEDTDLVNAGEQLIKYLTQEQKDRLCEFWKRNKCIGCPLTFILYGYKHCYKDIQEITKTIEEFWNTSLNKKQQNVANDTFFVEDKGIK